MEETQQEIECSFTEAKDKILSLQDTYAKLVEQRDRAKSITLKQLLDKELRGYVSLTNAITKYIQLYCMEMRENQEKNCVYLENALEVIDSTQDKTKALDMLGMTHNVCNVLQDSYDIDFYIVSIAIRDYTKVIDRNHKKWDEFAKLLMGKIADATLDTVPVVSEIKNCIIKIKDVAELVNEFEENALDYSEEDRRLFEIENHIHLMGLTETLINESIDILESKKI